MLLALLGCFIASFMLCVVSSDHLLRRSHCDGCGRELRSYELIPVVSFLVFRSCRSCGVQIPAVHLVNELLLGVLFYLAYSVSPDYFLLYLVLMMFLIPLSIHDIETFKVPNRVLLLLVSLLPFFIHADVMHYIVALGIIMLLHLFYLLTHAIGYGDIKLLSIFALLLPWDYFLLIFLMTYILGGMSAIIFLMYKTNLKKVPLVPMITASTVVVFLQHDHLYTIYFGGFQ